MAMRLFGDLSRATDNLMIAYPNISWCQNTGSDDVAATHSREYWKGRVRNGAYNWINAGWDLIVAKIDRSAMASNLWNVGEFSERAHLEWSEELVELKKASRRSCHNSLSECEGMIEL